MPETTQQHNVLAYITHKQWELHGEKALVVIESVPEGVDPHKKAMEYVETTVTMTLNDIYLWDERYK